MATGPFTLFTIYGRPYFLFQIYRFSCKHPATIISDQATILSDKGHHYFRSGHHSFRSGHHYFRSGHHYFRSGHHYFRLGHHYFRSGHQPVLSVVHSATAQQCHNYHSCLFTLVILFSKKFSMTHLSRVVDCAKA